MRVVPLRLRLAVFCQHEWLAVEDPRRRLVGIGWRRGGGGDTAPLFGPVASTVIVDRKEGQQTGTVAEESEAVWRALDGWGWNAGGMPEGGGRRVGWRRGPPVQLTAHAVRRGTGLWGHVLGRARAWAAR